MESLTLMPLRPAVSSVRALRPRIGAAKLGYLRLSSYDASRPAAKQPKLTNVNNPLSPARARVYARKFLPGRRHIVHSDELLSAFLELEATLL